MLRRFTTILVAIATAVSFAVAPAMAASRSMYRDSGRAAQTSWIQVDGTRRGTSPLGNTHVGFLYAYQTSSGKADAFAFIDDFDCRRGRLPDGGGHGFEGGNSSGCRYLGSRFADGYGLTFSMDRKLETANLKGQLTVYGGGHGDGGVIGRPQADITWTGVGPLMKQSSNWTFSDGSTTYTDRYRSTDRMATMSGTLGPMGFAPDLSGGQMSAFTQSSKSRTK